MKKLVIVGCGRLAEIVADAVVKGLLPDYNLVGVYSRTASKAAHIVHKMQQHGKPCIASATLEELLALKPDYLVESASPAAMRELALPALKNGTSVLSLIHISLHFAKQNAQYLSYHSRYIRSMKSPSSR